MEIYGMEKLSLVDYDGLTACTLFTGGCNMRCPFCHNKDLVNRENLEIISQNEIFDFLEKRKKLLDGVVITGGEPTLNSDLPLFLARIKKLGYKTKLDTNGTNPKMLDALILGGLIDYAAVDIKNSKDKYSLTAGAKTDIAAVSKSVEMLINGHIDYEFRTTLVEDFHEAGDMKKIGVWLKGAKMLFLQQFVDRGTCLTAGLSPVPEEKALEFMAILKKYIARVELRGY